VGIFARLREDTDRSELVAVLAFFAGIAAALAVGGDQLRDLDGVDPAIWLFISGLSLGFVIYWLGGWALGFVVPRLGGRGTRRQTRHILAFSFAPLVVGLLAWLIWPWLLLVLAVASVVLLVLGLREVEGWSTARAGVAVALAVVWLATLIVCLWSVLGILNGAF
jgi:hypothetical protein